MNLEELREFCLSFPEAAEDIKWGKDLCFLVSGKMFCVADLDAHVGGRVSFKCTPEKFTELVEREGVIPAPYVARYHWVAVENMSTMDDDEIEDLVTKSYMLVFEKLGK
ncbi:MAG TPA: MmcQ/YjbR family DNA-binding protein [Pyrinomonadaceae bacterium]|nr:MmcQ/YjbR family DNA-binding protein [Pyrinomonadaceae bacterium]